MNLRLLFRLYVAVATTLFTLWWVGLLGARVSHVPGIQPPRNLPVCHTVSRTVVGGCATGTP